jgi:hypothetical protein
MNAETEVVLIDVRDERERQDGKWGGAPHDDEKSPRSWHDDIHNYNAWAFQMAAMGDLAKARRRWVQVAALAVAVVERIDRKAKA